MTMNEIIDVPSRELTVSQPVTLFQTDEPAEVVEKATKVATALANVIRTQKLASTISGKEYVRVEGWTLLGSMLGVFPVEDWTRPLANGWEARVEARRGDQVVGAAEAMCTRDEKKWATADEYAIRSMAQTRATAKALRMPLGFVMQLAGFAPTPYEEMPREGPRGGQERPEVNGAPSRPPVCKQHGAMAFRRAGTSSKGKAYPAFWACENRECKESVDAVAWSDHLNNEAQPKATDAPALDDLPSE